VYGGQREAPFDPAVAVASLTPRRRDQPGGRCPSGTAARRQRPSNRHPLVCVGWLVEGRERARFPGCPSPSLLARSRPRQSEGAAWRPRSSLDGIDAGPRPVFRGPAGSARSEGSDQSRSGTSAIRIHGQSRPGQPRADGRPAITAIPVTLAEYPQCAQLGACGGKPAGQAGPSASGSISAAPARLHCPCPRPGFCVVSLRQPRTRPRPCDSRPPRWPAPIRRPTQPLPQRRAGRAGSTAKVRV